MRKLWPQKWAGQNWKNNHTKHSQANFRTLTKKNFIMLKMTIPYHFKSLNLKGDEKVMNFQRKRDQNEDKWKKRRLHFCKVYFYFFFFFPPAPLHLKDNLQNLRGAPVMFEITQNGKKMRKRKCPIIRQRLVIGVPSLTGNLSIYATCHNAVWERKAHKQIGQLGCWFTENVKSAKDL